MGKTTSILCLAASLVATVLAREVQIRPNLVPGDDFELEVTRTRADSANPKANYTASTQVTVKVVSVGPAGLVVDWVPGQSKVGGAIATDPMLQTAGKILGDVQLRLSLEPDGTFRKLTNQNEVVTKVRAAVDYLMAETQRGMKPDDAQRVSAVMHQVFTPANLVNMATRDPQTYLAMYGADLEPGSPVEIPIEQPNPFGGEALAATLRVRLDSASEESARISSSVKYQSDSITRMTVAMLTQATGRTPPAEELAKLKFNMSDDSSYVFDRNLGIFREVTTTRKISSNGVQRVDRCVIKLVREPKR